MLIRSFPILSCKSVTIGAQFDAPRFGGLKSSFCSGTNTSPFFLCHCRIYVQHEPIRVWHIDCFELYTRFNQPRNKANVTSQTVQFCNEQNRPGLFALGNCKFELRSSRFLATFDFEKFRMQFTFKTANEPFD